MVTWTFNVYGEAMFVHKIVYNQKFDIQTWSPLKLLSSKAVRAHPARTPTVSISFLHFKFLNIFFKFFYLFFSIFYLFFPLFTHWHVCISATHQQPCQLLIRWNKSRVQNEPMSHAIQTLLQLHKLGLTLLWGTGTVCPSTCMCRKRKSRDHMSSYDITIHPNKCKSYFIYLYV